MADKPLIGFLLVTYSSPASIARLTRRLGRSFADAPIVCHHDFDQCALAVREFPNVEFVAPHRSTSWSGFDTLEAVLAGLRTMLARNDVPEWIVLLSSADYPIKPAAEILAETCGKSGLWRMKDL